MSTFKYRPGDLLSEPTPGGPLIHTVIRIIHYAHRDYYELLTAGQAGLTHLSVEYVDTMVALVQRGGER